MKDNNYQPRSLLAVLIIAVSVMVMLLVCLGASRMLLNSFAKNRPMQLMQPLGILTAPDNKPLTRLPAPHLELDDSHADRMALYQRQSDKLNSYGWVDRSNGIVRIPIDRAMAQLAARGLPVSTDSDSPAHASSLQPPP